MGLLPWRGEAEEQHYEFLLEGGWKGPKPLLFRKAYDEGQEAVCEIVFNTSMAGYQEIISDPSYTDQAIVMSYPLIGNYGITDEDFESKMINLGALIVREVNEFPSNFRFTRTLSELLEDYDVPGVYGVDTRKLVRSIRDFGSRKVLITDADTHLKKDLRSLKKLN